MKGKATKGSGKSALMARKRWPVATIVDDLVQRSEERGLSAAEAGALVGEQQAERDGRDKSSDAQSFYDVRDGVKRLWVHDAERWAQRLGGTLRIRYEDDPWADLESAIAALPPRYTQLKRHLRAIVGDERETTAAVRPKARAAASR